MMNLKTLLFLPIVLLNAGCFGSMLLVSSTISGNDMSKMYSGHPQFLKPSEKWLKDGSTDVDVKKAKLECGYTYLDESVLSFSDKQLILADRCMQKAGFVYYEHIDICKQLGFDKRLELIKICDLPLSEIPDRDVKKRLNALYCKKYAADSPECQP